MKTSDASYEDVTEEEALEYMRGFDAAKRLGELGQLPIDSVRRMASYTSRVSPEIAGVMLREYDTARTDYLMRGVQSRGLDRRVERIRERDKRLSQISGFTEAELERVRAGGHDRASVEARASLYRL